MIERAEDDNSVWYVLNGNLHRPNGPAMIWKDGEWCWLLYGKWHRYYGPSRDYGCWWIHNVGIK
jgi:hypothetical protein